MTTDRFSLRSKTQPSDSYSAWRDGGIVSNRYSESRLRISLGMFFSAARFPAKGPSSRLFIG